MAITPVRIQSLQERNPIVDDQRRPVVSFIRSLNLAFRTIQEALNGQGSIVQQLAVLAGIVDAQGNMIEQLQQQQEEGQTESSLQNSGVVNEVGPLTATSGGNITIPDHSRLYGNQTLNPTVAVTGDSVASGMSAGTVVYIYYDDPMRAGGAVSYQYSNDLTDAIQSGVRHSVGFVEIPAGPTQDGEYTRPR